MTAPAKQQLRRRYDKPTKLRIAGAILAGGRASRLNGLCKGMLLVDGDSIMQRLIGQLQAADITDAVMVANEPDTYQRFGVEVIPDIRTGIGPLGGIEAALSHYAGQADAVMVVPCDMAYLSAGQLRSLKCAYAESDAPVVFARTRTSFWHPLCAVMHSDLLDTISTAISNGTRSVRDMWCQADAVPVDFSNEQAFFNVNTFADVKRLGWEISNAKESPGSEISVG